MDLKEIVDNKNKAVLPGSAGEHRLQDLYGTTKRALSFYNKRVIGYINDTMRQFIKEQEMLFISTSDANGECDCSFRAGPAGFIITLNENHVAYPEFRGNGVLASLGNISENAHIGLLLIDFLHHGVGLHINGKASILDNKAMKELAGSDAEITTNDGNLGRHQVERWVLVTVEEAYVHCSKNIPHMSVLDEGDQAKGGGNFFKTKAL